jgi:hypothetical protein
MIVGISQNRPQTIAEIARRARDGSQLFDAAMREFIDAWQFMASRSHPAAIQEEPDHIDAVRDAYLAALAEHLALSSRIPVPDWTGHPSRFLREPFFAGGLESLKAILLVESPLAFRRRLIFIRRLAVRRASRLGPGSRGNGPACTGTRRHARRGERRRDRSLSNALLRYMHTDSWPNTVRNSLAAPIWYVTRYPVAAIVGIERDATFKLAS